jgi:hypothetical protein
MGLDSAYGIGSLKQGVVDSAATRPASPFEGQMIYETDTDKVLVWNGSAWYPNWNTAWGSVGYVALTSLSQTGITTAVDITGATITFTAIANRRYKASWSLYTNTSAASATTNVILDEGATTLQQSTATASPTATIGTYVNGMYIGTHAAGSVTWKLRVQLQAGTGTISAEGGSTYPAVFGIEDIGPA